MINTFAFITNKNSILQTNQSYLKSNFFISFKFENKSSFECFSLSHLYLSPLLSSKEIYFSIYIDFGLIENESTKSLIDYRYILTQYFFHPNYKILNQKPVICFNGDLTENLKYSEFINDLEILLIDQGYKGLQPIYFGNKSDHFNLEFSENMSAKQISTKYFDLLKNQYYVSSYIGIYSEAIHEMLFFLTETENKLLIENPNLHDLLNKYFRIENTNNSILNELEFTKFELENQKIYLEFFKNKDEAVKINQFYYNEYEILPLWYKKLGHIIKVLLGKRSLLSLFDNSLKKYKN